MKKIGYLICIGLLCCFTIACSDLSLDESIKTEFKIHEQANIDHYNITLNKQETLTEYQNVPASNGQYLSLAFKIKNNSDTDAVIQEDNFYLEIDDHIYNPISFSQETIASKESKEITIIYDVPNDDNYELIFYSGIVSNNIAFDIEFKR